MTTPTDDPTADPPASDPGAPRPPEDLPHLLESHPLGAYVGEAVQYVMPSEPPQLLAAQVVALHRDGTVDLAVVPPVPADRSATQVRTPMGWQPQLVAFLVQHVPFARLPRRGHWRRVAVVR